MLYQSLSNLDQCRVQIDVVWHDDGAHNSNSLFQLRWTTAGTVRQEHPLQELSLVWLHKHILKHTQKQNTEVIQSQTGHSAVIITS